jgi:hypothetical protein
MKTRILFLVALFLFSGGFSRILAEENAGDKWRRFREHDKWGFMDEQGKTVIKPQYDDAKNFHSGLAPVNIGAKRTFPGYLDGGVWGYIDTQGKIIVSFSLEDADEFFEGLAKVEDKRGTRFIDPQGKTVIDLGKEYAGDFHEGLARVGFGPTKYIDKTGKVAFTIKESGNDFHEGSAVFYLEKTKLYGYIDKQGKQAIPPRFASAQEFSDGLAAVRVGGNQWGFIDHDGEYVIELQYNDAESFDKGKAKVHTGGNFVLVMDAPGWWEGGEWLTIDKTGKILEREKDKPER